MVFEKNKALAGGVLLLLVCAVGLTLVSCDSSATGGTAGTPVEDTGITEPRDLVEDTENTDPRDLVEDTESTDPRDLVEDTKSEELRDVVEDTATDVATTWWSGIDNRCAPDEVVVPPEPYRPGRAPFEDGAVPRVLWEQVALCPQHPELGRWDAEWGRKDGEASDAFAYMEYEIDGEVRELVVTTLDGEGESFGEVVHAMVVLDANTGESVACYPTSSHNFLSAGSRSGGSLRTVSEWGRFFTVMSQTVIELPEGIDFDPTIMIWSDGPGEGGYVTTFKNEDGHGASEAVVVGNGQIVAKFFKRLASFDVHTGEALWTVGEEDFPSASWFVSSLVTPADGALYGRDQIDRLIAIDGCGALEVQEGLFPGGPLRVGDVDVFEDAGAVVVTRDGVEVVREELCFSPVFVTQDTVACLRPFESWTKGEVVVFGVDGETHRVIPLPEMEGGERSISIRLVAGADGTLLMNTFERTNPEDIFDITVRLWAIDTQTATITWSHGFVPTIPLGGESQSPHPILTPRGVWIVPMGGGMVAVQTDVMGLAPTSYPRGALGGNENRGFVELPVEP